MLPRDRRHGVRPLLPTSKPKGAAKRQLGMNLY
jgi:hypothetical protein